MLIVVEVGSASVAIVVSFAVSFVVSPVDSVAAVAGSARTWQRKVAQHEVVLYFPQTDATYA